MSLPKLFTGRRRWLFALLVVYGLLQAVLGLAAVLVFEKFFHSGFSDVQHVIVIFVLAAILYVGRILQRRHGEMFGLDYVNETRLTLMEKVLSAPDNTRTIRIGLMTARLSTDLLALKNWLADGLAVGIVQGTTLVALLAGAVWLFPAVALVLAAVLVPWTAIAIIVRPSLRNAIAEARKLRGRLANTAADQVVARLTLAHFGRTAPARDTLLRRGEKLNRVLIWRATLSEALRAASDWALPVAALTGYLVFHSGFTTEAPRVAPLLLLLGIMTAHLSRISRSIDFYLASTVAVKRLTVVLDSPGLVQNGDSKAPEFKRGQPVEFELVLAGETANAARLRAAPGEVMALTSGTPEQRSDILMALARLRDDVSAMGIVDGIPLNQFSIKAWRKLVTLVSPRLPLIRGTLLKNLAIGVPTDMPDEAVLDLAQRFGLAGSPEELKASLDLNAVPAGKALAIRLCRGLLRATPVILLDETAGAVEWPMIEEFLKLAKERQTTVITSGCVLDKNGKPLASAKLRVAA